MAQRINGALFGQIGGRAGLFHFLLRIGRSIHRQADDGGGRLIRFDLLRRFDPIHLRHIDVHYHHIRIEPLREFDRFRSIARFADHFEMLIRRHDAPQALPHHRMVVHQQHADFRVLLVC